jgi:hypothetical protein
MLELTEKELLNPARNKSESVTHFKARRRLVKHAGELYIKTGASALKSSYFEFVRACIAIAKK